MGRLEVKSMGFHTKVGVLQHPHRSAPVQAHQKALLRNWPLRAHRKCAGVPHTPDRARQLERKAGWTVKGATSSAGHYRKLVAPSEILDEIQGEIC